MEENKRKAIILTFIGALTLLFVVVGGTFAYFQIVNTGEGETKSTLTGETEGLTKYGTPTLTQGTNKLHINLKASDMAVSKSGTEYWATNVEEKDYETGKQQHIISTASVSGAESEDTELSCTSELTIKASGTILEDTNPLIEEDGYVYLGSKNGGSNKVTINPTQIDLKQIIDKSIEEGLGYQTEVSYTIKGNTSIDITVDIDIINRDANQNSLAGKSINFTITNKNISCSVKEPKGKAYMKKLTTMVEGVEPGDYVEGPLLANSEFGNAVTASFVDYIPSDLEDEKIIEYMDLTDTELSSKGSVIAWTEETEEHNGEYNLYIGSESEIYAKDLTMAFRNMSNLKAIYFDNLNTSETTDMSSMFAYYSGASLDLSNFDTSQVTNMEYMFQNCENLEELKLGSWNLSSLGENTLKFGGLKANITFGKNFGTGATDMSSMFEEYQGTTLDLSTFDTSSVIDMSSMFSGGYRGVVVNATITFPQGFGSETTNMSQMFSGYKGATLDLSNFDTSSVTNMRSMFSNSSANITFPQGFGTGATNMSQMFSEYQGTTLDLSTFDTSSVTDMSQMFYECRNLTTLDLSSFTFDNVSGVNFTFKLVPESCQVKIKSSQRDIFESKFPLGTETYDRKFTPSYVD